MRLVFFLSTLLFLTRCGGGAVTGYNPNDTQSPSSLTGSEGGSGIQTDIWSNNPSQRTLTNENSQFGP